MVYSSALFVMFSKYLFGVAGPVVPKFFFFLAEDGIRDRDVTGVQTCALPISAGCGGTSQTGTPRCRRLASPLAAGAAARSEERRVGEECRSRGWASH